MVVSVEVDALQFRLAIATSGSSPLMAIQHSPVSVSPCRLFCSVSLAPSGCPSAYVYVPTPSSTPTKPIPLPLLLLLVANARLFPLSLLTHPRNIYVCSQAIHCCCAFRSDLPSSATFVSFVFCFCFCVCFVFVLRCALLAFVLCSCLMMSAYAFSHSHIHTHNNTHSLVQYKSPIITTAPFVLSFVQKGQLTTV